MYEIVDTQTGKVVGTAKSLKAASCSCDRRDNAYGAYRFLYRNALAAQAVGRQWQKEVVEANTKSEGR